MAKRQIRVARSDVREAMPHVKGGILLVDAQEDFSSELDEGPSSCPCCGRHAQIYERPLNTTMVHSLIWLVKQSARNKRISSRNPKGWVDVPKTGPKEVTRTNQLPTMAWWGLCEKRDNSDPRKKSSGIWRPTKRGIRFVKGKIPVEMRVATLFGEVVGMSDDKVYIHEIVDPFNYKELLAGRVEIFDL